MNEQLFYDGVITICSTRYGGAYEKCGWVAFSCGTDQIEAYASEAFGEDGDCMNWWDSMDNNDDKFTIKFRAFTEDVYIGRGNTPSQAHKNLLARNKSVGVVSSDTKETDKP